MFRYLFLFCMVSAVLGGNHTDYNGYHVFRVQPTTRDQLEVLSKLLTDDSYDFWTPLNFEQKPIDVMVHPQAHSTFVNLLQRHHIQFTIFMEDVGSETGKERLIQKLLPRTAGITFKTFHSVDEIYSYLHSLALIYPQTVEIESIGKSYEGRDLNVIKISRDRQVGRPIIFIDAGIHAREWLAPSQALYIIEQLVQNITNRNLFDKVDWHILPLMNPDGYEYSLFYNPYWRKTRSLQNRGCYGVDANRNFDFYWGSVGGSRSSCTDTYIGPSAFSETETRSVRDYLHSYRGRIKLYLTLHSYGKYLLYPWGYTSNVPDDAFELHHLAEGVNRAIMAAGGPKYTVGSSTNVLYPAAGGSDDWAKAVAGIDLSYTIELPGGRKHGFHPENDEIHPFVMQTFAGIKVFGQYVALKFG